MKTLYVASNVDADTTRKRAAEDLYARVISYAKKVYWTVRRSSDRPLDISCWTMYSMDAWGPGEAGARKKLRSWKVEEIVGELMRKSGEEDMYLYPISLTYDAKENVEYARMSFRINLRNSQFSC